MRRDNTNTSATVAVSSSANVIGHVQQQVTLNSDELESVYHQQILLPQQRRAEVCSVHDLVAVSVPVSSTIDPSCRNLSGRGAVSLVPASMLPSFALHGTSALMTPPLHIISCLLTAVHVRPPAIMSRVCVSALASCSCTHGLSTTESTGETGQVLQIEAAHTNFTLVIAGANG
jgi:hypothetical protein